MLDGRHTGTGGGNHVTLGGATPADSPCCGGPTCSQPRSRTGRTIRPCPICSRACSSARPARHRASTRRATTGCTNWRSPSGNGRATRAERGAPKPWLVDRLLRNLLDRLTGNTHRAEFSIDKLYSPDTADRPARPAGIPCLRDAAARADELLQLLLLRALIARFWQSPTSAADRWGTESARPLHAAALRRAGYGRRDR